MNLELTALRVSLARVAQAIGVQTEALPVTDLGFQDLCDLAKRDRGWNNLAGKICEQIENMQIAGDAMASQLELVAHELRETMPSGSVAWSDMIDATERQARLGREFFPGGG